MSERVSIRPIALVCNTAWYAWKFRANTIRALQTKGYAVVVIAPPDEAIAEIQAIEGVLYQPWMLSFDGRNPLRELTSLIRLSVILFRIRPAFVFCFTIKANIYSGIVCRLLRIPFAPNVTGLGMAIHSGRLTGRLIGRLYARTLLRARSVFFQNPNDRDVLRSLGLSASVPVVLLKGSGVDLAEFSFYPMPSESLRTFVLISRLQVDKGVREFVEAAREMRKEGISARFIIVGGTNHTNASAISENELNAWRHEGIVELVGEQKDVRPWLRRAHILVLPSYGEGAPRVLMEAAAVGRPAIVSDVPGCRELVVDQRTGLICAVRDPVSLADAMKNLASAPADRIANMGRSARRLAETCFSEERVIDAYIQCLSSGRESERAVS